MIKWMVILFCLLCSATGSAPVQERCAIAQDLVVQARERAYPGASRSKLEDARQLLKQASSFCPSLGDAYYYRYLLNKQLGNQSDADFSLKKAREFNSEALNQGIDPFTLSTGTGGAVVDNGKKLGAPEAKKPVSTALREKWALVVGISKFRAGQALPKLNLQFPAKDARDFAAFLKDPNYGSFKPENVQLLTDEQATTVKIRYGLSWLAQNAGKDDLVVIYLSSHGSPREADAVGVSYVVTHDTDISSDFASTKDGLYATGLPMDDIVQAAQNRIKAERVVVFLDTCYSGAALSGAKSLTMEGNGVASVTLDRFRQGIGRVMITASGASERSWESQALKNGIFTFYLIQGLRQNNGRVPVTKVYAYLRDQVVKRVREEKGMVQTPTMSRSDQSSEFSLGVKTSSQ